MKRKLLVAVFAGMLSFAAVCPALAQKKAVNPNSAEDVAELKSDAEKGDRGAQYELSMVYTYKQDAENAMKWLTKSAENGYGRAQYTLGNLYYNGSSKVKRDYEKAVKWFEASKETAYKGAKVDELIASAKEKLEEQKKAAEAKKKAADEAKKKAAAEAARKAKAAVAVSTKTVVNVSTKAASGVKEAAVVSKDAVVSATGKAADFIDDKTEAAAKTIVVVSTKSAAAVSSETKSLFQKAKEKVSSFFN
jgi:TPR repeat protein